MNTKQVYALVLVLVIDLHGMFLYAFYKLNQPPHIEHSTHQPKRMSIQFVSAPPTTQDTKPDQSTPTKNSAMTHVSMESSTSIKNTKDIAFTADTHDTLIFEHDNGLKNAKSLDTLPITPSDSNQQNDNKPQKSDPEIVYLNEEIDKNNLLLDTEDIQRSLAEIKEVTEPESSANDDKVVDKKAVKQSATIKAKTNAKLNTSKKTSKSSSKPSSKSSSKPSSKLASVSDDSKIDDDQTTTSNDHAGSSANSKEPAVVTEQPTTTNMQQFADNNNEPLPVDPDDDNEQGDQGNQSTNLKTGDQPFSKMYNNQNKYRSIIDDGVNTDTGDLPVIPSNSLSVSGQQALQKLIVPLQVKMPSNVVDKSKNYDVTVVVYVNKNGQIMDTPKPHIPSIQSSGNKIIDNDALRLVKNLRFSPFLQDNNPVVAMVDLPISYKAK